MLDTRDILGRAATEIEAVTAAAECVGFPLSAWSVDYDLSGPATVDGVCDRLARLAKVGVRAVSFADHGRCRVFLGDAEGRAALESTGIRVIAPITSALAGTVREPLDSTGTLRIEGRRWWSYGLTVAEGPSPRSMAVGNSMVLYDPAAIRADDRGWSVTGLADPNHTLSGAPGDVILAASWAHDAIRWLSQYRSHLAGLYVMDDPMCPMPGPMDLRPAQKKLRAMRNAYLPPSVPLLYGHGYYSPDNPLPQPFGFDYAGGDVVVSYIHPDRVDGWLGVAVAERMALLSERNAWAIVMIQLGTMGRPDIYRACDRASVARQTAESCRAIPRPDGRRWRPLGAVAYRAKDLLEQPETAQAVRDLMAVSDS